jgi:hypothetical protein
MAVIEAVRACQTDGRGWRKKDLLRGRPNPVDSLFALFREVKDGGATPAQIEGVLVAMYNAGRAIATEGLAPINESLADAIRKEQEKESAENVDTIDVLAHPTPGNLRKLRASMLAEMEAQRHVVDVIDAELLKLECAR